MSAELLQGLIDATLASSVAVLLIAALRKPLRAAAGARAAYWLWLLVPALVVAALLPAPSPVLQTTQITLPAQIRSVLAAAELGAPDSRRAVLIGAVLAVWVMGAVVMLVFMIKRQRTFVRSLGLLTCDDAGLHRSTDVAAPMLVGGLRPMIVVPADFEARYSPDERELVLAHERAHERRGDVAAHALACLALCVFWFNPLIYRALAWLRMDQELACDALVLSAHGTARRRYADALLKTQLATDAAWRQPIGCHWQSVHPLKERISMLKRPLPGRVRRFTGLTCIAGLTAIASYAAWAGQAANDTSSQILVDFKITITNPETNEVKALATRYLVRSGEEIKDAKGQPLDFACTPYLTDADDSGQGDAKWHGMALPDGGRLMPRPGQIFVECEIRRDGSVVDRPIVLVNDGNWATIETREHGGPRIYRIAIRPSTAAEDIAAAKESSKKG